MIAEDMIITQQQVSYDLKVIRGQWLQSTLVSFNDAQSRELARIDLLEETYWDAWMRSQEEMTKSHIEKAGVKADDKILKASVRKEKRDGNATYLSGIQWCIEQRCKIFGLYEPEKFAVVDWRKEAKGEGVDAGELFESLVNQFAEAISEGAGEDSGRGVA